MLIGVYAMHLPTQGNRSGMNEEGLGGGLGGVQLAVVAVIS